MLTVAGQKVCMPQNRFCPSSVFPDVTACLHPSLCPWDERAAPVWSRSNKEAEPGSGAAAGGGGLYSAFEAWTAPVAATCLRSERVLLGAAAEGWLKHVASAQ